MATNDEWWKISSPTAGAVGAGLMAAPATVAPTVAATGYDPAATTLNPKTDTVAGQLDTIIGADSPIMQRAATRADQQMNKRGLMNSSMAVGAGQAAVMDAALPIASQDATTSATVNRENTAAANNQRQFTAGATNTAASQTAQLGTQVDLANAENTQQANLARADFAHKTQMQQLSDATRVNLANIEADYKTLIQTSASAGDLYKGTVASVSQIIQDPNMDQASKTAAINGLFNRMSVAMNLIGSINGVDLSDLLQFGTVT